MYFCSVTQSSVSVKRQGTQYLDRQVLGHSFLRTVQYIPLLRGEWIRPLLPSRGVLSKSRRWVNSGSLLLPSARTTIGLWPSWVGTWSFVSSWHRLGRDEVVESDSRFRRRSRVPFRLRSVLSWYVLIQFPFSLFVHFYLSLSMWIQFDTSLWNRTERREEINPDKWPN